MVFSRFTAEDLQGIEAILPKLDEVVTVKNCIYYLSLQEQFAIMLTKFKDHLDAFHARAEKRYENWVQTRSTRKTYETPEPPLDVAYIHHAHLLSPHRYLEDSHRLLGKMLDVDMPLERLHQTYVLGEPNTASKNYWIYCSSLAKEPYVLEVKDLNDDVELDGRCRGCYTRLYSTWNDYGQWRADPEAEFRCWSCSKTVDSQSKAMKEFSNDINVQGLAIASDLAYIRGTLLDENGVLKPVFDADMIAAAQIKPPSPPAKSKSPFKRFSSSTKTLNKVPPPPATSATDMLVTNSTKSLVLPRAMMQDFFQGTDVKGAESIKSLSDLFVAAFDAQKSSKEYTKDEKQSKEQKIRDIAYGIEQYYNNPSRFSVDLIQQAKRQCVLGTRMLKARWQFLDDLVAGIRQYKDYLGLMKNIRHWVGDPPLLVHLAWHVHMMHPQRYHTFTTKYVGRLLEHQDDDYDGSLRMKRDPSSMSLITSSLTMLQPSRERPPPEICLPEASYQHGTIDVATNTVSLSIRRKLAGRPDNFDSLPYVLDPKLTGAIFYASIYNNGPDKRIIDTKAPKLPPPRAAPVINPTKVRGGYSSSGGGYTSTSNYGGYSSSEGYGSFGYSGCGGGGYSGGHSGGHSSSCGGGGTSSSGCGGGASSSGCGGGGCGGGGGGGCGGC